TLDQPVPALGNKSPRAAVKTASGRAKVADWLKMMENRTARAGESNSAMASYSFDWMWTELGSAELAIDHHLGSALRTNRPGQSPCCSILALRADRLLERPCRGRREFDFSMRIPVRL